jgi:hypothetical protein
LATSRTRREARTDEQAPPAAPASKSARRRRRRQRAARARAEREAAEGNAEAVAKAKTKDENPRAGERAGSARKPSRRTASPTPPRADAKRPSPSAGLPTPPAPRSEKVVEFPVEARRVTPAPERIGDDVLLFRVRSHRSCTRFVLKEAFD